MREDLSVFKVAHFLASRARETSVHARHPALPKRVNLPSLQHFLVSTQRTGNAEGTILKHCLEERDDAHITSGAAEETPLAASLQLRPHLVNQRFRFHHDRVSAPLLRWRNISHLFIPHSRQTSHQVSDDERLRDRTFWSQSAKCVAISQQSTNASFAATACCRKKTANMCGTPRGYSKPLKSNGRYISLSLTIDKSDQVRIG